MKLSTLVTQLLDKLPQYSDAFTTDIAIKSISTAVSNVYTVACMDKHNLKTGGPVRLQGVKSNIACTATRVGDVGTLTTGSAHDLTYSVASPKNLQGSQIVLADSPDAAYNGTFDVISVVDANTITFVLTSGPAATASVNLLNGTNIYSDFNRTYRVESTPTPSTFTIEQAGLPATPYITNQNAIARGGHRISAGSDIERLIKAYTEHNETELWAFVVLNDVTASKSRHVLSDATENQPRNTEYRQQVIQPFSVYVFVHTAEDISGRLARDTCEDLFRPLCQALLFKAFDSGLYVGSQGTVGFENHGIHYYDSAFYVHEYQFSQVVDITFDDTVGYDEDVRAASFDLTIYPALTGNTTVQGQPFPKVPDIVVPDLTPDPLTADGLTGDGP